MSNLPDEQRRAVSQDFSGLRAWGDKEDAAVLSDAWEASRAAVDEPMTHALHPYPGRMHWAIARELIKSYGQPKSVLLDPFAGAGSTILEGMMGGLRTVGVDLNPLTPLIIRAKTRITSERDREAFVEAAEAVGTRSEDRVRARARAKIPISKADGSWYSPHVLFEMSGLLEEIRKAPDAWREPLEVVFSALTTKFSMRKSETSEARMEKRIRKGLVTEFFVRRSIFLAEQWGDLEKLANAQQARWKKPTVINADARSLDRALGRDLAGRVDLVVTSPPYAGTYDYVDHHRLRMGWLGLRSKRFADGEIGSRRQMRQAQAHVWRRELGGFFKSLQRVCRKGAPILLVMGDGKVGREVVSAVRDVREAAQDVGLGFVAAATVKRSIGDSKQTRTEAIIMLR